ncbi:MAG: hypothetical protein WD770_06090 [Actinomycetota bacterium]
MREGVPRAGYLYVAQPDGSRAVQLGPASRGAPAWSPAWSPDGARLAFERVGGIYVTDAEGRQTTQVVPCRPGCLGLGSPAWSPDGGTLAFLGDLKGRHGLWTVNSDGSQLKLLKEGSFGSPDWSWDGRLVAVSGQVPVSEDPNAEGLFLVRADTGETERVIHLRPLGLGVVSGVSWSPKGDWLAFGAVSADGGFERAGIYLVRPDGSDLRRLTVPACPPDHCTDLGPAWSPDGQQIVFTRAGDERGTDGNEGDLYAVDVESGAITPLTTGPGLDCCASWQRLSRD